jgi:hypothetical protein
VWVEAGVESPSGMPKSGDKSNWFSEAAWRHPVGAVQVITQADQKHGSPGMISGDLGRHERHVWISRRSASLGRLWVNSSRYCWWSPDRKELTPYGLSCVRERLSSAPVQLHLCISIVHGR